MYIQNDRNYKNEMSMDKKNTYPFRNVGRDIYWSRGTTWYVYYTACSQIHINHIQIYDSKIPGTCVYWNLTTKGPTYTLYTLTVSSVVTIYITCCLINVFFKILVYLSEYRFLWSPYKTSAHATVGKLSGLPAFLPKHTQ